MITQGQVKNLEFADLYQVNLSGADLRGARLRGARLVEVDLSGADLTGADVRDVLGMWSRNRLDGATLDAADLRGSDLSGASLACVSLQGANLEDSRWESCDLRGADLTRARVGWRSIWLTESTFRQGNGASVWFDHADLSGAVMTEAHLPGASFFGARFDRVDATGGVFTGANFAQSDVSHASFDEADLCGVDFRSTRISGGSLRGTSLLGSVLIDTVITDVDLTGARTGGTVFWGSDAPSVATDHRIVHLGPSLHARVEAPSRTVLVMGGRESGNAAATLCSALQEVGLRPFLVDANDLRTPAGPVVAVRAFESHGAAIVFDDATDSSILTTLRRSVHGAPSWASRAFTVLSRDGLEPSANEASAGALDLDVAAAIELTRTRLSTNERYSTS
ncbi:pentapeptide repeat-containing protein [Rhodococcus sp. USK13]|uniref:pentapeptide repeat-containing protein n=1 Tax=Rhodococcus sp. USK13 TaxID=2806442 RepID=UPI001BCA90C9|nr:pentapeptide repeat-containing protein [Rhodococcus sp. USK13]